MKEHIEKIARRLYKAYCEKRAEKGVCFDIFDKLPAGFQESLRDMAKCAYENGMRLI